MKNIRTGDQSGGLKPEHGGSTPVKSGGVSSTDENQSSKEVAVTTESMNAPNAFVQQPGTHGESHSETDTDKANDDTDGQSVAQY